MLGTDGVYWTVDEDLFLSLDGGKMVAEWFGYVPSFHDASMSKLELRDGHAELALQCFRMTNEVDEKGYFVLDRHVLVNIHLSGVTGVTLSGDASSAVHELAIRRVEFKQGQWGMVAGPVPGDFEVRWESNYGLEGAIFARDVHFLLVPTEA